MGPLAMQHPSVPCLFWGRADHSLSCHRLDIELQDPDCCWWPGICNPWVACGCGGFCLWVLCADNAVTCSRPWEVHRTRIFIITDDIALRSQTAPVTMPATDPFTTSSVEIVQVASDRSSVCSDFVHVATEPVRQDARNVKNRHVTFREAKESRHQLSRSVKNQDVTFREV